MKLRPFMSAIDTVQRVRDINDGGFRDSLLIDRPHSMDKHPEFSSMTDSYERPVYQSFANDGRGFWWWYR